MKRMSIAEVSRASYISPNMIRIRLKTEAIRAFPKGSEGGHIKLVIPLPDQNRKEFTRFINSMGVRKRMRTYTIRHLHLETAEVDVDFVAHGDNGPASAWAIQAQIGDFIGLSFPGGPKLKPARSNTYLVAVDMTAFPAAAAGIEKLPNTAKGDFYAEILSEDDIQPVNTPEGIRVHWIVNPDATSDKGHLISAVRSHPLTGEESVFVAGEFDTVGDLRNYFRKEKAYPKDQLYISSYWKQGLIESEHKRVKAFLA